MANQQQARGEYEETLSVRCPPPAVFDFVADVRNMPKYLPTTKSAEARGEERVAVHGEAMGHRYDAEGYLRRDDRQMRLEWGADEGYYSGWLAIKPDGDASAVTVHISLRDAPPGSGSNGAPDPANIKEGLRKGLESIRNHCEGRGGKEEPRAAT